MVFSRLRRQAKWVFVLLAVVFASSFVLFGVGTGFGGLQDLLTHRNGGSSGAPSISKAEDRIRANPKDAPPYLALAQALQNAGRGDAAVPPLEHYIKLRPRDRSALGTLGALYLDRLQRLQQDYSAAQFKSQQETFGQTVQPPLQVGHGKSLPPDPITQAQTAATDQVINTVTTEFQAIALKATGVYGRLAALSPTDPAVQLQWAQTAESAHDSKTAVRGYKRFLKLAPDDPSAGLVKQRIKQLERVNTAPAAR